MIVVAILAILAALSSPLYRNFIKKNEMDSVGQGIIFDLKRARTNSMSGENGLKWGIRFTGSSDANYYQIFSTPVDFAHVSTTIDTTIYLPKNVFFSDPNNSTKDIIFEQISGAVSPSTTVVLSNTVDNVQKTIYINTVGNVY